MLRTGNDRYKYLYRILSKPCYTKVNIKWIDNIHKSSYKVIEYAIRY